MASCDDLVNNQDLANTKKDAVTVSDFVESDSPEIQSKNGKNIRTLQGINDAADNLISSLGGVDIGDYEDDLTLNSYNEYVVFDRAGATTGPSLWKAIPPRTPTPGTPLPYTIDSATYPDPTSDTNIEPFSDINKAGAEQIAQEEANAGDSQLAGGNIWPLSSQDSAQAGDTIPIGTSLLRFNSNIYTLDEELTLAKEIQSIDARPTFSSLDYVITFTDSSTVGMRSSGGARYNKITNAILNPTDEVLYDSYLTIKATSAKNARNFTGFNGGDPSTIDSAVAAGYEATDEINDLILQAAQVIQNMTYFQSYNYRSAVRIPNGDWIVDTIVKYDGVDIIGESPAATRIWSKGSNPMIIAGVNNVTPLRPGSSVEEKLQGRIENLSLIGRKDPTYDPLTIAGRVGKTHVTDFGIHLDGAFGQFVIKNVDVQYCNVNWYSDNSWTLKFQDCRSRFATLYNSHINGGNLTHFENTVCTHGFKNWRFDKQQDGESANCVVMRSCDGEHSLYEDIESYDVRQLTLDNYYSERNAVRAADPAWTTIISFIFFGNTAPVNRGTFIMQSGITIKSIATDYENAILINIDAAEKVVSTGDVRISSSSVITSAVRLGVEVGDVSISGNFNPFNVLDGVKPVDYASGCKARVSFNDQFTPKKNLMTNGDLFIWQEATSQNITGYRSLDRFSLFKDGADTVELSRQNFLANQTTVPGYPRHYARMQTTGAVTQPFGVLLNCCEPNFVQIGTTLVFGCWMKSDVPTSILLGGVSIFPGDGLGDSKTRTYQLDTAWRFYCVELEIATGIPDGSISPDSSIQFRIEAPIGFSGSVDFAACQIERGFPTSLEKIREGNALRDCQHYKAIEPLFGQASQTVYVRFPQQMREIPTVTFNPSSNVSASNITQDGMQVDFTANYSGEYTARAEYS